MSLNKLLCKIGLHDTVMLTENLFEDGIGVTKLVVTEVCIRCRKITIDGKKEYFDEAVRIEKASEIINDIRRASRKKHDCINR